MATKIITDGEGNFSMVGGGKRNRAMTEAEAVRVLTGDLRNTSTPQCVKLLGLNYGQIYSARYGDTFKHLAR